MGTLRKIRSEGTKERRADELDQTDLAYGVPPGGVPLVLSDEDHNTVSVKLHARRSDFLEKIGQAWRDYASHPEYKGKPARMAIGVSVYNHDGKKEIIL